jgi:hypothetical protein
MGILFMCNFLFVDWWLGSFADERVSLPQQRFFAGDPALTPKHGTSGRR